jgi:hypothetical protein
MLSVPSPCALGLALLPNWLIDAERQSGALIDEVDCSFVTKPLAPRKSTQNRESYSENCWFLNMIAAWAHREATIAPLQSWVWL